MIPHKHYVDLPIFSTGDMMRLKVHRVLARMESRYHDILVADVATFGRSLIIDDIMQCAETDHHLYDSEMLKLMGNGDRRITVLGGGDGYIAQMALRKNPGVHITVVDADDLVVDFCRTHLGQRVFDHAHVSLCIDDVVHYLRQNGPHGRSPVHGVVCDLTDSPIGAPDREAFEAFFEEVFRLAYARLAPDGWISVQAGASFTAEPYVNSARILSSLLQERFGRVQRSDRFIPSYGEPCAFLFSRKQPRA